MKNTLIAAAMGMSVLATGLAATPASAQRAHGYVQQDSYYEDDGYQRDYRDQRGYERGYQRDYRDDGYRGQPRHYRSNQRCRSGSTGTILGAVAGALLGGEIGRGNGYRRSGTGTVVGAGAGALIGREIDRGNCNDRRSYRRHR
ncbi:MAG: glycine zipper 2TM domain-containing protein [Pseudomonadota bacterium]